MSSFSSRKFIGWIIVSLAFIFSLSISAMPRLLEDFSAFQYLHLVCLMLATMVIAGEISLVLLFVAGVLIDAIHGQILGSSSLLLVLIVPYIQLWSHSALRFSLPRIWLLFVGFLVLYQAGQIGLQMIFSQSELPLRRVVFDSLWTALTFPFILAVVLYVMRRFQSRA